MHPTVHCSMFMVVRTWKQPGCPSMEKMSCICTVEYCSAIKGRNLPFAATWMDLEIIMLGEMGQRKTNISFDVIISGI